MTEKNKDRSKGSSEEMDLSSKLMNGNDASFQLTAARRLDAARSIFSRHYDARL